MKLDLTQLITNKDGSVLTVNAKVPYVVENDKGEAVEEFRVEPKQPTLGLLIENALLKQDVLEEKEIIRRYELFLTVQNQEEVDLVIDDVRYIKGLISKRYDTWTAGKMYELINNKK